MKSTLLIDYIIKNNLCILIENLPKNIIKLILSYGHFCECQKFFTDQPYHLCKKCFPTGLILCPSCFEAYRQHNVFCIFRATLQKSNNLNLHLEFH